jgi:hypothetical protein
VLLIAAATLPVPARAAGDPPDPKAEPKKAEPLDGPALNLFLNTPADLKGVLERLSRPDFLLLSEEEYRKRIEQARASGAPARRAPAAVVSVVVDGQTRGDLAELTVELGVALSASEATSVPIRLDEQNLTDVREGERVVPARNLDGKGWEVELSGKGAHLVRVRLSVRVKRTGEGSRLELAIPEAPSTRFQLDVPNRVVDAVTGANEPVDLKTLGRGLRTRLSQLLTARPRLDVSWRVEAEPRAQLPPLLSMQGEVAIDVDPGSFRTRSSWMVYAMRGSVRSLEFRLDPEDEVLELELDGQPPPAGIERVDGATKLTVNLSDPLRPGEPKKLVMATRRPLPAGPAARVSFAGFPLANAKEQSGAIGIAKTGNLWVQPASGRGLRQIDPRELPADLRVRPATSLAYQFVDQPFDLSLRVEPSPPLVSTRSRTRVGLRATEARVETWLDYQVARGRLFELSVAMPRGLELESIGPADVADSWKVVSETPDGVRLLSVLLTPRARERGNFSVVLTGHQPVNPSGPLAVDLFQPRGTTTGGGRIAVVAERNLSVELPEPPEGPGGAEPLRPAVNGLPADWPWPADRGSPGPPALWLRHDGNPASLPLLVSVHPRTVSHQTTLLVQLARDRLDIRQETRCSVHFGTLSQVEVLVPAPLQGHWDLDADEVSERKDLGPTSTGEHVYRLRFAREVSDKVRLRFHARLPLASPVEPGRPADLVVPWIRVREGSAEPMQVTFSSEPGLDMLEPDAGWVRSADEGAEDESDGGAGPRTNLSGPEPSGGTLRVVATAQPVTVLPSLVVSRHLIRTVEGPEGQLRSSAAYWVEVHDGSLALALPAGGEWVRARVAGEPVGRVDSLPQGGGYRLRLPPASSGPVLVELEYNVPARFASPPWSPPRLLDGGVVQETFWEVRLPENRAVVGVPRGWTDQNEWYWDRYVWKRRPWRGAGELTSWVSGSPARASLGDGLRGGAQSYLFGRTGPPGALPLTVTTRAWLVALCSGAVLALGGLFFLTVPVHFRALVLTLAALGVAVAAALDPAVTFLALQSAEVGAVLVLFVPVIQRVVGRRRLAHSVFGEPNRLAAASVSGSSYNRQAGVGSDDPTAVRPRPASTVDVLVAAPPPVPESAGARTPTPKPGSRRPGDAGP